MRLTGRKTRSRGLELNLTSMIDVIFLLLIFFIVSAGMTKPEKDLESALQTQSAAGKRANLEPIIVDIVPEGGGFQYKVGGRTAADRVALTDVLRQLPGKANGAFVRVRDEAPFVMAAAAVQAAHDAGFPTVNYIPVGHK